MGQDEEDQAKAKNQHEGIFSQAGKAPV